jgi:hypothetical protein
MNELNLENKIHLPQGILGGQSQVTSVSWGIWGHHWGRLFKLTYGTRAIRQPSQSQFSYI